MVRLLNQIGLIHDCPPFAQASLKGQTSTSQSQVVLELPPILQSWEGTRYHLYQVQVMFGRCSGAQKCSAQEYQSPFQVQVTSHPQLHLNITSLTILYSLKLVLKQKHYPFTLQKVAILAQTKEWLFSKASTPTMDPVLALLPMVEARQVLYLPRLQPFQLDLNLYSLLVDFVLD